MVKKGKIWLKKVKMGENINFRNYVTHYWQNKVYYHLVHDRKIACTILTFQTVEISTTIVPDRF